jgi:hypothetical protein
VTENVSRRITPGRTRVQRKFNAAKMPTGIKHAMNPISPYVKVNCRLFGNIHLEELFAALLKYRA